MITVERASDGKGKKRETNRRTAGVDPKYYPRSFCFSQLPTFKLQMKAVLFHHPGGKDGEKGGGKRKRREKNMSIPLHNYSLR